jgi:malonyl-CoA/methylmalonyl-CoA synthetase
MSILGIAASLLVAGCSVLRLGLTQANRRRDTKATVAITRLLELDAQPAVTAGGTTLSYRELREAVGGFAEQLTGVSRAAVWAHNSLEAIVAMVATVESGVELVPLNPKLGSSELDHILSDARPDVLIGPAGASVNGTNSGVRQLAVDPKAHGDLPEIDRDPESPALLIYTSGTTGRPKGVLTPERAITSNLDALAEAWAWTETDSLTHALPLFHVHGLVLGIFGPLRRGGHVHHLERFTPQAVAAALAGGATMLFAVPTMYHRLAEAAETDPEVAVALRGARLLVSGSAGLPAKTFERIQRVTGQRIAERYGLTETIMNTAVRADGERRPGEVGRPLDRVELRLVTEDGDDAAADGETIGEILVRGPNLFLGYLNRPEATAQAVRDGWFWTGDLATRAPDGYLRIVGRKSTDLIKTGGYKVGAGEVEGALLEHVAVSEAAVKGEPDEDLGERITAWVVLDMGSPAPTEQELSEHVGALLAPHKRPRRVYFVTELPRNAMGKVIKQRLTSP